jgi:hypothetical protein
MDDLYPLLFGLIDGELSTLTDGNSFAEAN